MAIAALVCLHKDIYTSPPRHPSPYFPFMVLLGFCAVAFDLGVILTAVLQRCGAATSHRPPYLHPISMEPKDTAINYSADGYIHVAAGA